MPSDTVSIDSNPTKHLPRFRQASVEERPAFRLTDRDRESFKIIYENRWITAEMLQDFLSPVTLTPRQQEALAKLIAARKARASGRETAERRPRTKREIQRRLEFLFHHGYVKRKKLSDNEPIAYAIGNKAAEELMLYYGIDRQQIEWTTKNRECGEPYIRHALMVTGLRHAVVVALRDRPDVTLKFWEPDGAFQAKVQYEDRVHTQGGTRTQVVDGTVKPDSLFLLLHREKGIHYFPEADRSTMSNGRYFSKLKAYYAFWATYVRDGKSPIKQMRVLTITRSEERKQNLRKIADQLSPEAKNLFWFICEKAYLGNPQQVFAATWQTLEDDTLKQLYTHA